MEENLIANASIKCRAFDIISHVELAYQRADDDSYIASARGRTRNVGGYSEPDHCLDKVMNNLAILLNHLGADDE